MASQARPAVSQGALAVSPRLGALLVAACLALGPAAFAAEHIDFDSVAPNSDMVQVFQGRTANTDHLYGELQLPAKGTAPFPAMVIMHSSMGINDAIGDWVRIINDLGIASFVVDSFAPRGLSEFSADRLSFPAGVVDALRALQVLQRDPRIDARRIGAIGFSRGAVAAMNSSFERYRAAVLGTSGGRFALHIAFYGGCAQFARTTGSPILAFVGTKDDFNNVEVCRRDAEILNRQGTKMELVVYDGAPHAFDTNMAMQNMPGIQNFRRCAMLQNLDTFEAFLLDGRTLNPEERNRYAQTCPGRGASRGGDSRYAAAAREKVKLFLAEQFGLH